MEKLPINREEAIKILESKNNEISDFNHYFESEAIMKELAKYLKQDEEYWSMLGLLHDIDWSETKNKPEEHLKKTKEILKKIDFDEEFIKIIISHGYGTNEIPWLREKKRTKKIEHALACSDSLSGLIHSYALMRNNKISDMESKGLMKKFKDKAFASKINREIIKECEFLGLSLNDFFKIAIEGIKKIKNNVGLD